MASVWGGAVPEGLAALWRASDGLRFGAFEGELLGGLRVLDLVGGERWPEELVARGIPSLFHDGQSNHLVVHLQAPLRPRVSFAPHDDSSRVRYRGVESFLADALVALNERSRADLFVNEAEGDYTPDARAARRHVEPGRAELLEADAAAFEELAAFAMEAARAAGLEVRERRGDSLRVGERSFNLDGLFHRR